MADRTVVAMRDDRRWLAAPDAINQVLVFCLDEDDHIRHRPWCARGVTHDTGQSAEAALHAYLPYATLCLVRTAPLAVAEASYAVLRASAPTTERQRALDEAMALIRRIQAA